jgi:DNA-binding CsgD family transcriptional regulator
LGFSVPFASIWAWGVGGGSRKLVGPRDSLDVGGRPPRWTQPMSGAPVALVTPRSPAAGLIEDTAVSNESISSTITANGSRNNHEVRIRVERDDDANRISAVLEALGYTVLRELEEGDGPSRLRWAVERLAGRYKLTQREQDILEGVLAGRNNDEIGRELEISRATVKWHMHNLFAKTSTGNRENLLRLALQLGGMRDASELALSSEVRVPTGEPTEDVLSKPWF